MLDIFIYLSWCSHAVYHLVKHRLLLSSKKGRKILKSQNCLEVVEKCNVVNDYYSVLCVLPVLYMDCFLFDFTRFFYNQSINWIYRLEIEEFQIHLRYLKLICLLDLTIIITCKPRYAIKWQLKPLNFNKWRKELSATKFLYFFHSSESQWVWQ